MQRVFLFDLNGTIIDDMEFHAKAWYEILTNKLGAKLSREEVKSHMYGKNEELLIRIFGKEHFSKKEMQELSVEKEKIYQQEFLPSMKLINGLASFLEEAYQHQIPMAIGTAAITFNVDYIVNGLKLHKYFPVIISADDVEISKPHPETFTKCADALHANYKNCIVFEDSPKGVEAALNAGMKAVVIKTYHTEKEFSHLPNVLFFIDDYNDVRLKTLFQ
jgi:HAD superfamily hydrolase (TIGR01509 family)